MGVEVTQWQKGTEAMRTQGTHHKSERVGVMKAVGVTRVVAFWKVTRLRGASQRA